jgi:hypothetical protein
MTMLPFPLPMSSRPEQRCGVLCSCVALILMAGCSASPASSTGGTDGSADDRASMADAVGSDAGATVMDAADAKGFDGKGSDASADGTLGSSEGGGSADASGDGRNGTDSGLNSGCGSPAGVAPSDAGSAIILPSLGLNAEASVYRAGSRVLGATYTQWILFDVATGNQIASGKASRVVGFTASTFAVGTSSTIEVHSTSTGALLGSISAGASGPSGLASDGSYVWAGTSSGLTAWSPAGASLVSRPGDYSKAAVSAIPGTIRVALGPAGSQVIENVAVAAGGTSTTTPAFSGTFAFWFVDGSHFATTFSGFQLFFTPDATQVASVNMSVTGGWGQYYWTFGAGDLTVYPLQPADSGPASWAAPYTPDFGLADLFPGDGYLAIQGVGGNDAQLEVVSLQSWPPVATDTTFPFQSAPGVSFDSNGDWVVADTLGDVLYHGATGSPTRTGYLGCGPAIALGGSPSGRVGIATESGTLVVVDVATASIVRSLTFSGGAGLAYGGVPPAGTVRFSADGKIVAVSAGGVTVFDVASGAMLYQGGSDFDVSMDSAGAQLGRATASTTTSQAVNQLLTNVVTGVDTISDSNSGVVPAGCVSGIPLAPLLSPNGAVAVLSSVPNEGAMTPATAFFFDKGMPATSINGYALGWIDDDKLLVGTATATSQGGIYLCSYTYELVDHTGAVVATPSFTFAPSSFDVVASPTIYLHSDGNLYNATSGARVKTLALPGGTIAGSYVITVSGDSVVATPY